MNRDIAVGFFMGCIIGLIGGGIIGIVGTILVVFNL